MSIVIRALDSSALPQVAAGAAQTFRHPWSAAAFADSLNCGYCLLGIEVDQQLAGHALFSQVLDEAELQTIAIYPQWQRRGLARLLLRQGIEQLRQQGVVRLLLDVRAGNHAAISLYESLGFVLDGRRKGYYPAEEGDGVEDALLMSLML
ncbi:hypothetical protein WH50_14345 [Pokkaliibacter plantistimulans]|uniref:[Ribosomal protein bS18]-alanine N-acetyltransferase n=1 Tax=Pokkaliibacter plantistimulans TaxID=1635171 RepID=A0ABX5M135_9GAMM|nr:ribosomal protein S18-alanine N-acetyltransferase [Pokkaliibacter plantistimulans]PXF30615.1 hypothetical protein WH50_14345 [Pokkaliibacter plantistimulans]